MVRKNGLGKGLDSLIPSTGHKKAAPAKPEVKKEVVVEKVIKKEEVMVKITEVEPNREQPRKNFNEDALLELADSIKQFGIIQPLVVQKQDDYYEIIAGERRWRAAKLAGLKEVPVIIKNYTEQERVEIALIENIQREDLNPIEEAMAFKRLLTQLCGLACIVGRVEIFLVAHALFEKIAHLRCIISITAFDDSGLAGRSAGAHVSAGSLDFGGIHEIGGSHDIGADL